MYLVWGGAPGPRGVPGPGRVYLVPGGVPGLGGYLVPGGVPGLWGVYLVPGGCTWSQGGTWSRGYLVQGGAWSGGYLVTYSPP